MQKQWKLKTTSWGSEGEEQFLLFKWAWLTDFIKHHHHQPFFLWRFRCRLTQCHGGKTSVTVLEKRLLPGFMSVFLLASFCREKNVSQVENSQGSRQSRSPRLRWRVHVSVRLSAESIFSETWQHVSGLEKCIVMSHQTCGTMTFFCQIIQGQKRPKFGCDLQPNVWWRPGVDGLMLWAGEYSSPAVWELKQN